MRQLRWFLARARALFTRSSRERELDAEIAFHLSEDEGEAEHPGESPDARRQRARRSFGSIARIKEDARQVWTWSLLEQTAQDLRYAARVLRHRPVFSITAILSLALGTGATTAVFSLIKSFHLDRLRIERPGEMVQLEPDRAAKFSYAAYDQLRRTARTLTSVTGSEQPVPIDLLENGELIEAHVEFVTENYFEVLGIAAARGRVLQAQRGQSSRVPLAVISEDYWREHYAADPSALGSRFRFPATNLEFTVVGVAPREFRGVHLDAPADIWLPLEAAAGSELDEWRFRLLGRLRPSETRDRVAAETTAILGRPVRVRAGSPGYSALREQLTRPLLLLALVVGLVFLITCANLANLSLAAGASRERELEIRRSIGASRSRIVRQLATENAILSCVGAVIGVVVAHWMTGAVLAFLPPSQARALVNLAFGLDEGIVAFVVGLCVVIAGVCGVWPAARATRWLRTIGRHADGAVRNRSWNSRALLAGQVAMCTLLLLVAATFVRSLQNLLAQDTGFDSNGLVTADVRFPFGIAEERRDRLYEELRARLNALPEVVVASYSHMGQLRGSTFDYVVAIPGRPTPVEQRANEVRAAPGFLAAMGTVLLEGRDLAESDRAGSQPVALINQAFGRTFGLDRNAVGRTFNVGVGSQARTVEIVGVVEDSKWLSLREGERPMYYVLYQQSSGRPIVRLAVRGAGSTDSLALAVVSTAAAVSPQLILTNVVPFREIVNRTLVIERLISRVASGFAGAGVLIACIGVYGVFAYAVVRRRREIGVRIAIGATPTSVQWMLVRESIRTLVVGFAVGLPLAVTVLRLASSLLFGLGPASPMIMIAVAGTLTATTFAAAYIPTRRASRTDPLKALRED